MDIFLVLDRKDWLAAATIDIFHPVQRCFQSSVCCTRREH
jgi:hypothetical protein